MEIAMNIKKLSGETPTLKYAKSFCIEGKDWDSDQTDYQIKIVCHKGKGNDTGEDVYLGNDIRDDFGDVRFRDDIRYLSYWIERCILGDSAVFWLKVPKIPKNDRAEISLHYGNSDMETTSNGKDTFKFFDDFLGNYNGKCNDNVPDGWENVYDDYNVNNWIVKDSTIMFRGRGHLNTISKVWSNPSDECYTLRFRAKWPEPVFVNPGENGESIGGISWKETDGNSWMDIIVIYNDEYKIGRKNMNIRYGDKLVVSFGRLSDSDHDLSHAPMNTGNCVILPFKTSGKGAFYTYEFERRSDKTIARIIELGEEATSENVIHDQLYLMIHACHFGFNNSPYISVDWMLLRKTSDPEPLTDEWKQANEPI